MMEVSTAGGAEEDKPKHQKKTKKTNKRGKTTIKVDSVKTGKVGDSEGAFGGLFKGGGGLVQEDALVEEDKPHKKTKKKTNKRGKTTIKVDSLETGKVGDSEGAFGGLFKGPIREHMEPFKGGGGLVQEDALVEEDKPHKKTKKKTNKHGKATIKVDSFNTGKVGDSKG